MIQEYFATCPKGLESLLKEEISELGVEKIRETVAGVYFSADLPKIYELCLWSRIANRILFPLKQSEKSNLQKQEDLYNLAKAIPWEEYFSSQKRFVIDFIGTNQLIRNSQFGAQRVKDAIVDRFKEKTGVRPSVSKENPDVRLNVRLAKGKVYFSLDMSGDSLHMRGYRKFQGAAPLKENLAAAILMRCNWKKIYEQGGVLIDPMCGSGTFLIEGAMQVLNIAPGTYRKKFGFENLLNFDIEVWNSLYQSAIHQKENTIKETNLEIRGYDNDHKMIRVAQSNIEFAGLEKCIRVAVKELKEFKRPTHKDFSNGLLICNPPYGERLGELVSLKKDYQIMGEVLKRELNGWQAGIFSASSELIRSMRLRPKKNYKLFNGAIPSQLSLFDLLGEEKTLRSDTRYSDKDFNEQENSRSTQEHSVEISPAAKMIVNRLVKNKKRMHKWIKENHIECYRIYDGDIPEYNAAIDVYGNEIHIQEYQAPKTVDANKAEQRFNEIKPAVKYFFKVDDANISIKVRRRNRGKSQYEKNTDQQAAKCSVIKEHSAKFEINLTEYLDTGLFLDHRPLRKLIRESVRNKTFLNLFCYTSTATVHAALGGAKSSVSVDMSNTYIEWSRRNFELNNINPTRHQLIRENCFDWLKQCRQGFDVIMLDPPSFSNSKKMETSMDIQRDHIGLIDRCMDILNPGGTLFFSTNLRSFKLDEAIVKKWQHEDISLQTLDPDFIQRPKIHYCWKITHKN